MAPKQVPYSGGPAARQSPLELVGQARCAQFILEKRQRTVTWQEDSDTKCWLSTTSLRPDGYISVKLWSNDQLAEIRSKGSIENAGLRHKEKNFMLHIISYVATHGTEVIGVASHLCGQKNCFNPDHIIDESQQVNIQRNYCPATIICTHGAILANNCTHNPPCRKISKVNCCYELENQKPPSSHGRTPHLSSDMPAMLPPSSLSGNEALALEPPPFSLSGNEALALEVELRSSGLVETSDDADIDQPSGVPSSPPAKRPASAITSEDSDIPILTRRRAPRVSTPGLHRASTPTRTPTRTRRSRRISGIEPSQAIRTFPPTSEDVATSDFVVDDD